MLLELINDSELSRLLRQSIWLYPLVNTGHIIGLGLLIGSIVPLDLRMLGAWRSVPLVWLTRVLIPVASFGFGLAILCGFLLFITRPEDYITSTLFLCKLGLVVTGVLNACWLLISPGWKHCLGTNTVNNSLKLHSALSLVIWFSVIICGRLIGYR